jgi:hypothetical protein
MSLVISREQLDPKKPPKPIGRFKGQMVFEFMTKGGFNVVATNMNGALKVLGAGPHRGFARFLAYKENPDFVIDELSKSEQFDMTPFMHLVPAWKEVVGQINEALSK